MKPERRMARSYATICAVAALVPVAIWVRISRRPPDPASASTETLFTMLAGTEGEAARAQEVMESRLGVDDPGKWKAALDSPSARARGLAIESIGKTRSPAVVALLTAALSDPASSVRLNAVQALATQDPALALRPMLAAVKDEDTWVSEHAAQKIVDLKRKEAVPELIAALRNPDRDTAVFALGALKRLTGQKMHASRVDRPDKWNAMVTRWEAWWSHVKPIWPKPADPLPVEPIRPSRTYPAPEFTVTAANGTTVSLAGLRGKTILLNFWGMGCGPCIAEMPGLNDMSERYAGRGLVVLGVECGGADAGTISRYAAGHRIGYGLAKGTYAITEAYGHVHDVPVSFLIDVQGRIRYQWDGDREETVYDAAVRRLLGDSEARTSAR